MSSVAREECLCDVVFLLCSRGWRSFLAAAAEVMASIARGRAMERVKCMMCWNRKRQR